LKKRQRTYHGECGALSLSGAAGAVDEETFVRSFEDVGKIYVRCSHWRVCCLESFTYLLTYFRELLTLAWWCMVDV